MASVYNAVCLNCGEMFEWYKYGSPETECPRCNALLSDGEEWDNNAVKVFGIGLSSVWEEFSEEIRKKNPKYWICDYL